MYTTKGTTPQVAVVSTSAAQPLPSSTTTEPLTYWTDARSSTMARPSPTVSNCGLVIVQVENSPRQFEENRTFYHEPQSLTNWSNITLDNRYTKFLKTLNVSQSQFIFRIFLSDSTNMPAQSPHPVIQEEPGAAQIVEVEETIEDDDEGYRTSPGSDTSPASTSSPPPSKVAKKSSLVPQQSQQSTTQPQQQRPQTRNGMRRGEGGPEESNNLMWLLDFKLDFFNEGQEGHHPGILRGKPIDYYMMNCV